MSGDLVVSLLVTRDAGPYAQTSTFQRALHDAMGLRSNEVPVQFKGVVHDFRVRRKQALVQVFELFDIDGDESLDMQEFLDLLKHTPLKIRQHDAMSMFNEVCFIVVNTMHPITAEELDPVCAACFPRRRI